MEIKPDIPNSNLEEKGWVLVEQDGVLKCSCGRKLIQHDENTWSCSAGFPLYRLSDGDVRIDKYGNLYMKIMEH